VEKLKADLSLSVPRKRKTNKRGHPVMMLAPNNNNKETNYG